MKHLADVSRACFIALLAFLGAIVLAACGTQSVPMGLPSMQPASPPAAEPSGPVQGEVIGTGDTRVAMLLPLRAEGNGARIAAEMKNAAQLAMADAGLDALQLVVKDTSGTEEGASAAATSALSEGASLILGPVFAPNVRSVSPIVAPRRIPVIAFSSDRTVARSGVYLNSFLPGGLVRRIISYAVSQDVTKVVAIVPNGRSGDLAESVARRTLEELGGSLLATARYDYDNASVQAAVQEVALAVDEADAVFIPDGGSSPSAVVSALQGLGVDLSGKRLLGTGQWSSANMSDPALQGGWFADVGHARMNLFKSRYQQRFGAEPTVTAALGYDSVILAATLAGNGGGNAFSPANLETPVGFSGYTGTFRFRADGTSERGYAVYEISDGAANLLSPAPTSIGGQS